MQIYSKFAGKRYKLTVAKEKMKDYYDISVRDMVTSRTLYWNKGYFDISYAKENAMAAFILLLARRLIHPKLKDTTWSIQDV